jgi:hypothetical protein
MFGGKNRLFWYLNLWSFEGFLSNSIYSQAAFAFLAGSSVAGLGTQRLRSLREVFMILLEDQLKRLEAYANNLYHAQYPLHNPLLQRAKRLLFKYVTDSMSRWPVLYISE